jgi:multidrug efflux pump subunit AcrA (membrane-fusion protein)
MRLFCALMALLAISNARASVDSKSDLAVVTVAKIVPSEISDELTFPARVTAKINTRVLSEIDGVVSQIRKPLGEKVQAGQVLVTMTHTDPVYQYAPVQVLAPVSGIVSGVEVTEGTQVLKGQPLLSVTNPSQVRVQIEIPSADLGMLEARQDGVLQITGRAETTGVRVRGISPFVDPMTGTAAAELDLIAGSLIRIAPGELGEVRFKTRAHLGLAIPDYAVIYRGSTTLLRLIENGKLRSVPVTLGPRHHGSVEILNGIPAGATVVERASRYVADGDAVTVQDAGAM